MKKLLVIAAFAAVFALGYAAHGIKSHLCSGHGSKCERSCDRHAGMGHGEGCCKKDDASCCKKEGKLDTNAITISGAHAGACCKKDKAEAHGQAACCKKN